MEELFWVCPSFYKNSAGALTLTKVDSIAVSDSKTVHIVNSFDLYICPVQHYVYDYLMIAH